MLETAFFFFVSFITPQVRCYAIINPAKGIQTQTPLTVISKKNIYLTIN